jgi:dipeptidyl aminopeptidase/acylaminoacyl peptidase
MRTFVVGVLAVLTSTVAFGASTQPAGDAVQDTPMIPRSALFGNPVKTQARISPDGKYISYIAPKDGVLNVFVGPANNIDAAKAITNDTKRGIRQHFWAFTGNHVLFLQDEGGDENWHLYSVDVANGKQTDLTPFKGIRAEVAGLSWKKPNIVIVGINIREPEWHDLYEVNIATGARKVYEENLEQIGAYTLDLDLNPRLALKTNPEGSEILRRAGKKWVSLLKYATEDSQTTGIVDIEGDGKTALMTTSVGRDKSALARIDLKSGKTSVIGSSEQADVEAIWLNPKTSAPQAYTVNYLKPEITIIDKSVEGDVAKIKKELGESFAVTSRTLDDRKWVVVTDEAQAPAVSYLYDRNAGSITKLFDQRPALANAPLVPMQALEIKSRDGLTLVSYLSLPPGSDENGDGRPDYGLLKPLVVNVHGGPWARDAYGFRSEHQWLANRGYAVLSVNFRGSTGLGKGFTNAGNQQWGRKMHDDLLDAVKWAVDEKIADPAKIAIYGGSYGGYAALAGLAFTPDTFACGVDIVGPSNLRTLFAKIPPYWKSFYEELALRVGDPRTEEGKKLLDERSPLFKAGDIKKPLLIGQGANDPRVNRAESDQIVAAMKAKNLPVIYLLYPDEGHGFARPQNRTSFYAISEAFLSRCIGGRFEDVGKDLEGSSIQILEGREYLSK